MKAVKVEKRRQMAAAILAKRRSASTDAPKRGSSPATDKKAKKGSSPAARKQPSLAEASPFSRKHIDVIDHGKLLRDIESGGAAARRAALGKSGKAQATKVSKKRSGSNTAEARQPSKKDAPGKKRPREAAAAAPANADEELNSDEASMNGSDSGSDSAPRRAPRKAAQPVAAEVEEEEGSSSDANSAASDDDLDRMDQGLGLNIESDEEESSDVGAENSSYDDEEDDINPDVDDDEHEQAGRKMINEERLLSGERRREIAKLATQTMSSADTRAPSFVGHNRNSVTSVSVMGDTVYYGDKTGFVFRANLESGVFRREALYPPHGANAPMNEEDAVKATSAVNERKFDGSAVFTVATSDHLRALYYEPNPLQRYQHLALLQRQQPANAGDKASASNRGVWLPTGYLASGAADGTVNIWQIYPSTTTMNVANEEGGAASPASKASAGDRAVAPVFVDTLKLHRRAVTGVAFRLGTYSSSATKTLRSQTSHSSAGEVSTLITASEDSTIRVWSISAPQVVDSSTAAGRSAAARLTASMIHCVDRYFGHRGPVSCISTLKKERCATGGGTYSLCSTAGVRTAQGGGGGVCDSTMRFWKLDTATQSEYSVSGSDLRRLVPDANETAAAVRRAAQSTPGLEGLDLSLNAVECVTMLDDVHVVVGTSSGLLLMYDITKNNTVFPNMAQAPLTIPDRGQLGSKSSSGSEVRTSLYNTTARHAALIQVVVCPHGAGFVGDGTGVESLQVPQAPGRRVIGNSICSMASAPYSDLLATASGGGDMWSVGKQATTIILWNVVNDFLDAANAANGGVRGALPKKVVAGVTLPPVRLDPIARIALPVFTPKPTAGINPRPVPVSAGFANAMSFSLDGSVLVVSLSKEQRLGRWLTDREALNGVAIIPVFDTATAYDGPVSSAYAQITKDIRTRLGIPLSATASTFQTVLPITDPSHTPARMYEVPEGTKKPTIPVEKKAEVHAATPTNKAAPSSTTAAETGTTVAAAPKGKRSNKGALKREKEVASTKKAPAPSPPKAKAKASTKKPSKK